MASALAHGTSSCHGVWVSSQTEFYQLKGRLSSANVALRDVSNLILKIESLTLVDRRTRGVRQEVVQTCEGAMMDYILSDCTAAGGNSAASTDDGDGA